WRRSHSRNARRTISERFKPKGFPTRSTRLRVSSSIVICTFFIRIYIHDYMARFTAKDGGNALIRNSGAGTQKAQKPLRQEILVPFVFFLCLCVPTFASLRLRRLSSLRLVLPQACWPSRNFLRDRHVRRSDLRSSSWAIPPTMVLSMSKD